MVYPKAFLSVAVIASLPCLASGTALAETYDRLEHLFPTWAEAVIDAVPESAIAACGYTDRIFVAGSVAQCTWLLGGLEVGYVTASFDGMTLCAFGEAPEAYLPDWVLSVRTGAVAFAADGVPCAEPIWWTDGK